VVYLIVNFFQEVNKMKKILCLVLAFMLLFSCVGTAFAAENGKHLPQIYVNGIGSRAIYEVGDPDKTSLFYPVNTEALMDGFANITEYAEEAIKKNNPDILTDVIYSIMWDTMGKSALMPDGKTNMFDVTYDPCTVEHVGDQKYVFSYDSRLDPVDLADELYAFITEVKRITGSERYELVSSSHGASIAAAFMQKYRDEWDNIDSVLYCVPSLPGIDFVGELFSGTFNFDPDVLTGFVDDMLGNEDVNLILSVLNKTGALDKLLEYGLEPVAQVALLRAVNKIIHDIFGTFPSMWTYVQDEYFYKALEWIYGEDYASPDHSHAELIRKITYYHEEVMVKAPETMLEAQKSGIHMSIIAKYGFAAKPLSASGNVLSDNLMDLEDVTYGATCSMRDETLPADYTQKLYPEYNMISADRCVDASTSLLPFNTWIIKGFYHEENNSAYWQMVNDIVYNNLDINSDARYPQFMQKSATDAEALVPFTEAEEKKETTLIQDFIRLLTRFIEIVTEKLKEFFAQ